MAFIANPSWDTFNDAANNLVSGTKELFTGKTKKQQDDERLTELDALIQTTKNIIKNPEEAKKIAEANLALAKKEYEDKNKAVKDLKKAYDDEKDTTKKQAALQKLKLAEQAEDAAKTKKSVAADMVQKTNKATGMFGYSETAKNLDIKNLKAFEETRAKLASGGGASGSSASGAASGGGGGASSLSGGSTISSSNAQLAAAGLRLKQGDTQKAGAKIDPKLLEMAEKAQKNIPGFNYFSAFNDDYHQENTPNSRHTKGLAFDFTVNPGRGLNKPSKEQSDLIIDLLKGYGAENVKNEYEDTSGKFRTGGHFHAELPLPKAYDGGVFDGPKGGFPVELHGREAIVPMPNPGDKISIDKAQKDSTTSATKGALSSVVADSTTSTKDNSSTILMDLYTMMEEKFDDLIDKMDTNNKYTDKILKYSQV
jgi:hypothetical protein